MKPNVCPRCHRRFPNWQPVHLLCFVSRIKYWIIVPLVIGLLFMLAEVAQAYGPSLLEAMDERRQTRIAEAAEKELEEDTSDFDERLPSPTIEIVEPSATQPLREVTPTPPVVTSAEQDEIATPSEIEIPTLLPATKTNTPVPPSTNTPEPAPSSSNTPSSGGGFIVYSGRTDSDRELFIYHLETGAREQLTHDQFDDHSPAWSPNGQFVAYTSERYGQHDVFVLNLSTGQLTNLTSHSADDAYPSWSPDSSRIVFHSNRHGDFDLFTIDLSGNNLQQITNNDLPDLGPKWSPDGREIAFAQSINNRRQLAIINVDGSNLRYLTSSEAYSHSYPTWSPDGRYIAFYMVPSLSQNSGLYLIDATGNNLRQLTQQTDFEPEWAPDGQWVLFHRKTGSGNRILYRIRPDSTDLQLVLEFPGDVRDGDWQP